MTFPRDNTHQTTTPVGGESRDRDRGNCLTVGPNASLCVCLSTHQTMAPDGNRAEMVTVTVGTHQIMAPGGNRAEMVTAVSVGTHQIMTPVGNRAEMMTA